MAVAPAWAFENIMHRKTKELLEKYFPQGAGSGDLSQFAEELDVLLQEKDEEIVLLERSVDLASDAMEERDDYAASHFELFETTFLAAKEALLLVDLERGRLRFNESLHSIFDIPEAFSGEMSLPDFLDILASHLDNPERFLTFLQNSHDKLHAFEGELLLRDERWLKYSVTPRLRGQRLIGRLWTLTDITEQKRSERALKDFQQALQNAHELAKMGTWFYDCATRMFSFSEDLMRLLGLSEDVQQIALEDFVLWVEESQQADLSRQFEFCQKSNASIQSELQLSIAGHDLYVIMRGSLKVGVHGEGDRILGVIQDISDLRTSEHLVKVSSHFFQSSMQGNVLMDRQRRIIDFNEVACGIFKLDVEEFAQRIDERLATAWTNEMSINDIWRHAVEYDHWAGEVYFTCPELLDKTLWLSLEVLRDLQGKVTNFIAIFNDITESKRVQEQLHHVAYFDSQTGLPNRFQFEQFLGQKLNSPSLKHHPMTLFYLDLDRFKFVNDSLGHHAGDQLLYLVGQRLNEAVPNATLVARQGGDEFIILVSGCMTITQKESTAERVIGLLSEAFSVHGSQVYIGASMGIVNLPEDTKDLVTAMRYADISLYQAKKAGKGCYMFWQRAFLQDSTPERILLESELRDAILQGQLVLHFQPKVEAESGIISGMEALVRWQHPRLGLVYPDHFIGIAEESNLIVELDRWVINAVAEQLQHWCQSGLPLLTVSVNVSAAHITRTDLAALFSELLVRYPHLSNCLEVELTETAIMADPDKATLVLNELRKMGVKASVDDFGSGYTSLGYLKKLNANTLKIDRSFIDGITDDTYDRDVARAIIALASSMSMDVVAEGVETKAQWELLQSFGCKYLQGFFFSKPKTAREVESLYLTPLQQSQ